MIIIICSAPSNDKEGVSSMVAGQAVVGAVKPSKDPDSRYEEQRRRRDQRAMQGYAPFGVEVPTNDRLPTPTRPAVLQT